MIALWRPAAGNPDFLNSREEPAGGTPAAAPSPKGSTMGKGNNRKGKEAKKPKQEKPKVLATANSGMGKDSVRIGGKTAK